MASVLALARRLRDETELTIQAAKGTGAAWRRAMADRRRGLVSALPIRAPIMPNPAHQRHIALVAGCSAVVAAGVAVIVFTAVLGTPGPPRPANDSVGTGGVGPDGAAAATPNPSTSAHGSTTGRPDQAEPTRRAGPGWPSSSPPPRRPRWPSTASASPATTLTGAAELGSGVPGTPPPTAIGPTQGPTSSAIATPISPVSPSPIVTGGTSTPTRKSQ